MSGSFCALKASLRSTRIEKRTSLPYFNEASVSSSFFVLRKATINPEAAVIEAMITGFIVTEPPIIPAPAKDAVKTTKNLFQRLIDLFFFFAAPPFQLVLFVKLKQPGFDLW